MYLVLLLLTALPDDYQGVWAVTHVYDFVSQEWNEQPTRRPLRAAKDHFKAPDGRELHFDKVINLNKGYIIYLKNKHYVIVTSGRPFIASWHRPREDGGREEYLRWLVNCK